jgi:sodium/potassium/calcium exchanger 6
LATAQRLKILFKNSHEDSSFDIFFNIIDFPVNLLRDYTIPAGSMDNWNRTKMTIVPITISFALCLLMGWIDDLEEDKDTCLICGAVSLVGIFVGAMIMFRTKKTQPPEWLLTLSSIFCFMLSIAWIAFTSDLIVDLLGLFGAITGLNKALLNLTVLAWGNCLGDMSADVAMTKKGFGEMAITATVAGPIFNVMIGGFLANISFLVKEKEEIHFTAFDDEGSFRDLAVLPVVIISS